MTVVQGMQKQAIRPSRPVVTMALIGLNVLMFALAALIDTPLFDSLALHFPHHPDFAIWQLASHLFVHGGPLHLLFNMMVLWMFGRVLEQVWGHRLMLALYLLIGVAAAALYLQINVLEFNHAADAIVAAGVSPGELQQMLINGQYIPVIEETKVASELYNGVAVGASGAIFGILVCFTVLFPKFKLMLMFIPVPVAARILIPLLLVMELFSAVTGYSLFGDNIAHVAHLTGALMGLIVIVVWRQWFRSRHSVQH